MNDEKKNWYDLKPQDFPENEPVLKMKRGLWYRPRNSGYTDDIMKAGFYEREDSIKYCFNDIKTKNGQNNVLAVPIRVALKHHFMDKRRVKEYREKLDIIEKYADEIGDTYVVF